MIQTLSKKYRILVIYMLAFSIPIYYRIATIGIVIYLIMWIIEGEYVQKLQALKKYKYPLIAISGIFFIYALGLLHSNNLINGFASLERKLAILILPTLLFTENDYLKKASFLDNVFKAFLLGLLTIIIINLGFAVEHFVNTGSTDFFYYIKLTHWNHPSYHGMMVAMGMILLLDNYLNGNKYKTYSILLLPFLLIYIFLNASKAAILVVELATISLIIINLSKNKKFLQASILLSTILLLSWVSYNNLGKTKQRVDNATETLKSGNIKINNNSTESRYFLIESGLTVVKQYPIFGVGTGDAMDELIKVYKQKGYEHLFAKELNPHNQYLQLAVECGISGLLMFLFLMLRLFILSFKDQNYLLTAFLIIFGGSILFESMFERASGVLFYSLFAPLILLKGKQSNKSESANSL